MYKTYNSEAAFKIKVGVDCQQDYFNFATSLDEVIYRWRRPAVPTIYSSPVNQYIEECGLRCSITTSGAGSVYDLDTSSGQFAILSDNKDLSGSSLTVKLTCSSPASVLQGGTHTKTIIVEYYDECWDAVVGIPQLYPLSIEMEMFTEQSAEFNAVSVSPSSCPYAYQFMLLTGGAPLSVDASKLKVRATPKYYDTDMGIHRYKIKACVKVESVLTNCRDSDVGQITVTDPCVSTIPIGQPINV